MTTWTAPTPAEVAARCERDDLRLPDSDAEFYAGLAGKTFTSRHEAIERWQRETQPEPPKRAWSRPEPEDNPFNAWYVTGAIDGAPRGALAGLTWAVKSNIAVAGWPMCAGSPLVAGYVPAEDATAVRVLLGAGAHLRGSTNAEDLGVSASSHTSALGPVRNPWRETHSTFGSSSGSAALVAAGLVDFALGTDQAGSVRLPASGTGLVGHKPTRGLVPYTGGMPFTVAQDSLGPLARDTRVVARVMDTLTCRDGRDLRQGVADLAIDWITPLSEGVRGLRIGLLRESFGIPGLSEAEVDDTVRAAVSRLASAGASVTEISIPAHSRGVDLAMMFTVKAGVPVVLDSNGGGGQSVLHADPRLVEHFAAARAESPEALAATVALSDAAGTHDGDRPHGWYLAAAARLTGLLADAYDDALRTVDVLVTPTVPYAPRPLPGEDTPREEWIRSALDMIVNTCGFNLTGHPGTQVPAGQVDGLPVGLQVVSRPGADALCLRVASALEDIDGGFPQP